MHSSFLRKLVENAPAESTVSLTCLDDVRLYITSEEHMTIMFKADDRFVTTNHNPALLRAISSYQHIRAPLDELHQLRLEQDKEKLPKFALFRDAEKSEEQK